ncbi:gliding motility-associated C-terminal domain-containing protein [uncultured Chitinophaga sp.]|uniref:gliding motility-associated C-terminal domain-containing protein n=1 Tax=uncultured Chitinophaga sp. TaxID=339340 RepID=UPI0034533899
MPNAFSPNGDESNDVFRPKMYDDVHNYQLRIYNRWGSLVFRANDPGNGWNGIFNGSAAPSPIPNSRSQIPKFSYVQMIQKKSPHFGIWLLKSGIWILDVGICSTAPISP